MSMSVLPSKVRHDSEKVRMSYVGLHLKTKLKVPAVANLFEELKAVSFLCFYKKEESTRREKNIVIAMSR